MKLDSPDVSTVERLNNACNFTHKKCGDFSQIPIVSNVCRSFACVTICCCFLAFTALASMASGISGYSYPKNSGEGDSCGAKKSWLG